MKLNKFVYSTLVMCISFILPAQCGGSANTTGPSVEEVNQVIDQGNKFFEQGQYEKAIGQYTIAIQMKPNSSVAYFSRGRAYFHNNGQYGTALNDFNVALQYDANYAAAYSYRGWSSLQNGAVEQALADFNKALGLDNSLLTALNGRAWCETNKAQWDTSSLLLLYQKFESDAGLPTAFKGKGWSYIKQMQWEYAVQPDPQKNARQNPEVADMFCNLAFACFKKAEWDVAIADFDKALAQDPTLNRSSWNRDWAVGKKQDWTLPINDYSKLITSISKQSLPSMEEDKTGSQEFWYRNALALYEKAASLSANQETTKLAKSATEYINKWHEDVKYVPPSTCCGAR
jgi:tetratricopeptide (TPR) repeat protein